MNLGRDKDLNYLDYGDDSDIDSAESSSEDEIDILLHGTPDQKRKLYTRSSASEREDSSEDDFEKEMNDELNGRVKELEKRRGSLSEPGCSTSGVNGTEDLPQKYEDDVYCDSDEEEMVTKGDAKMKQKQLTNEDLLYDPQMDDEDEKWVENHRRSYLPKNTVGKKRALPNSDAVLDCPACMTTLCLDCQRHSTYNNQYRAMFVMNCVVDKSELLKYPQNNTKNTPKSRKKQKKTNVPETQTQSDDKFHPVKCSECNTVVAVFDEDEVYHFFNVLASY